MKKVLFILIAILITGCNYVNEDTVTVTVRDKAVKYAKESSVYLIYTDKGVFKIEDQLFFGKFNSSDIYGDIAVGKTYKIETYGFRIEVFSEYKNIYSIVEYDTTNSNQ